MIPTSVSGSGSTQTAATATLGIASLILEGRALSHDDFLTTAAIASPRFEYQSRSRMFDDGNLSSYSSSSSTSISNMKSDLGPAYSSSNSNDSSSSDPTLQHMQRLRHKLGQLRQSSPGSSSGDHMSAEQAIAIGLNNRCNNNSVTTPNEEEDEDENALVQYLQRKPATNRFVHPIAATLQSLATTCLRTAAPRSNKVLTEPSDTFFNTPRLRSGAPGGFVSVKASTSSYGLENVLPKTIRTPPTRSTDKLNAPKQGPHCDQFLRKVGLTKADATADVEEHICDMANLNEICYRWQMHCRQIDFIMSTMDPICIEVYLGPENHDVLLEQWIIEQKEKSTSPAMTLQSLSNAIRSQLYFSQITAWTDLIKNAKPHDRDIIEHGRIKLVERNIGGGGGGSRNPRLDIFYRIRAYDATGCFNSKPNVHDFPNVVISENCSISVCLKSLPRIQNGIPRLNFVENENTNNQNNASCSGSVNSNSYNHSSHVSHPVKTDASDDMSNECGTDQSNSSVDESMVLDDRLNLPCQEKGKHRCAFDEEEYAGCDTVIEGMSSAELSHRQKQLLKYRKRMMKRDKKSKVGATANGMSAGKAVLNTFKPSSQQNVLEHQHHMELNESKQKYNDDNHPKASNYQQSVSEFGSINSYRPPLYRTQETTIAEAVQTNSVEMVSTGTQTPSFPLIFPCCDNCGSEMELICPRCDNSMSDEGRKTPSPPPKNCHFLSSRTIMIESCVAENGERTFTKPATSQLEKAKNASGYLPKLKKGDLLLQAIERAPRYRYISDSRNKNVSSSSVKVPPKSKTNDCQLCKRQKTQHVYRNPMEMESEMISHCGIEGGGDYELADLFVTPGFDAADTVDRHMSSDCACSDEYAENCCRKSNAIGSHTVPQKTKRSDNIPHELKLCDEIEAQFKTPKSTGKGTARNSPKGYVRPTPLFINCSEKLSSLKSVPKINLTNIFSDSPSVASSSAPIPILASAPTSAEVNGAFSFDNLNSSPDIPVQKSSSAPTLPNSPSLSPRFLKQAAIYKRRSRHLSDRSSERSSIGSDEQFSDEDLESLYSPTSSPIKARIFLKASGFGRRAILGSLEESLLQRRFVPKSQVGGFKVLLGASGAFCPAQQTIPAIASFYELSNEATLTTPYMCEIRLSRKGYTVPRVGTIQATLLNPLGTVVRMFVVPYDFRDMPAMSQTFIRQRVLAVDSNSGGSMESKESSGESTSTSSSAILGIAANGNLSGLKHNEVPFGEQIRSLRYAIHLRFQTSRTGRLALHTDIRLLISRRTDCDTAAAHAKGALESPNELRIVTIKPENPKYSARQENPNKI